MVRSVARLTPELWVVTRDNRKLRDITDLVEEARVSWSDQNRIPKTLRASLRDPDAVEPFTEYLAPFLTVTYNNGFEVTSQCGVYAVMPSPQRHRRTYSTTTLDARDLTSRVDMDAFEGTYSVPAGKEYITAVREILVSCGLTRIVIPGSGRTLAAARSWRSGTSLLTIVNELLNMVGYYPLWIDPVGQAVSRPFIDLTKATSATTFSSEEGSNVVGEIEDEADLSRLANVVVVERDSGDAPLIAIASNTNPASPTSIPATTWRVPRFVRDSTLADQAAADALAKRLLQESQSFYRRLTLRVTPDPRRDLHEVYQLDIRQRDGTVVADGRWWSYAGDLGFTPKSAVMTLQLARVQPFV